MGDRVTAEPPPRTAYHWTGESEWCYPAVIGEYGSAHRRAKLQPPHDAVAAPVFARAPRAFPYGKFPDHYRITGFQNFGIGHA